MVLHHIDFPEDLVLGNFEVTPDYHNLPIEITEAAFRISRDFSSNPSFIEIKARMHRLLAAGIEIPIEVEEFPHNRYLHLLYNEILSRLDGSEKRYQRIID